MPVTGVRPALNVERILLATDLSAACEMAEAYTKALALRFGASVDVVHVFDGSSALPDEDAVLAPFEGMRRKIRQRHLTEIEIGLREAGVEVRSQLCQGVEPTEKLLSLTETGIADLVVVATHGKSALERFMMGSTAEALIRRCSQPVLTIGPNVRPPANKRMAFNTIVYATDFSAQAAHAAAFAVSFAEDSGAQIYFCHVADRLEEMMAGKKFADETFLGELRRLVPAGSYEWCSPHCVVEHGKADEGILEVAKRVEADLIVLGPRKSTFALAHLERGVTPKVLNGSTCPVLTIS